MVKRWPRADQEELIHAHNIKKPITGAQPLIDWMFKNRPFLERGRPFTLDDHHYLRSIYAETAKRVVVCKSSQMGISEWLISYALHSCDQRNCTVFYVFPNDTLVSEFSAARVGPAIEASPYLRTRVVEAAKGKAGSDRVGLKRIGDRFFHLRGGRVQPDGRAPQLKTVPADVLILDELDEIDPRALPIARKRLGHSSVAEERLVSTPTYPGRGIHAEYMASDQRRWFVKCPHCHRWQTMTIDNIVTAWDDLKRPLAWHGQAEDTAFAACERCAKALDRLAEGEWVATYDGRDVVGYHINKLVSATTQPIEIVQNLSTVDETKLREAHNQDLGLPYVPRGGSLTTQDLDKLHRDYAHGIQPGRCYMGVDVGSLLHVVIRSAPGEKEERRQLFAGTVPSFEEVGRLIRLYNPRTVVIDALPETKKARELQGEFPRGKIWLSYYTQLKQGNKKQKSYQWDDKQMTANTDRTRSLDETIARFLEGVNTLPAGIRNVEGYYAQLTSSVRVLEKDATGEEVARYVETGADHYFHGEAYCTAASECPFGGWVRGS